MPRGPHLRWREKDVDFFFPRKPASEEEKNVLLQWWRAFKRSSHPHSHLDDSIPHAINVLVKSGLKVLKKLEAWETFHDKMNLKIIYELNPPQIMHTAVGRESIVEVTTFNRTNTIVLEQGGSTIELLTYPTKPLTHIFYAQGLAPGSYTITGFDGAFEIVTNPTEELGGETKISLYPALHPVSKIRIDSAWEFCRKMLLLRGKRASTQQEINAFIELHQPQGIAFCVDPIRKTSQLCWKSREYLEEFGEEIGDTTCLEMEHEMYEKCILAVLRRQEFLLSAFRMFNIRNKLKEFVTRIIHAPSEAEYCLFIGIWNLNTPDIGAGLLEEYEVQEQKMRAFDSSLTQIFET